MENRAEVLTALKVLKEQQDQLAGDPSDCFSNLLTKLFKVDTIPFSLYSVDSLSPFYAEGFIEEVYFKTPFFRIESLDIQKKLSVVSLLMPFDVYGDIVSDCKDVYLLKRTPVFLSLELKEFTRVKCTDIDLLRREIIIEPKW